jgi:hypothetical protein
LSVALLHLTFAVVQTDASATVPSFTAHCSLEQLAVGSEEYKKEESLNVETDGTYSNHWPLEGKSHSNNATQTTGDSL